MEIEAFFRRLRANDHRAVRRALGENPALANAFDPNPWCCSSTPLNEAAGRGDREMVDLLMSAGADIDRKSDWWAGGFAPIHSVSRDRHPDMADYLLERGARLDIQAACALGRKEDVLRLLDENPDRVNAPGGDGGRPLHFAADADIATMLLERGALRDPLDIDHGSTPAQWAAKDRAAVTRLLLERGTPGDIFMYIAIGDRERLEAAVEADPDAVRTVMTRESFPSPGSKAGHIYVFGVSQYGWTPLHACTLRDGADLARFLLEHGADPNARGGYDDGAPLHFAAWNGGIDMIDVLADAGADLEQRSGPEHKNTPAGWAVANGQVAALERLLERGATKPGHR